MPAPLHSLPLSAPKAIKTQEVKELRHEQTNRHEFDHQRLCRRGGVCNIGPGQRVGILLIVELTLGKLRP